MDNITIVIPNWVVITFAVLFLLKVIGSLVGKVLKHIRKKYKLDFLKQVTVFQDATNKVASKEEIDKLFKDKKD
jgi:hypothetical protein